MLEAGHTAIPNLALNHYSQLGLSPSDMLFVIHVWQYWWTERNPYPSLAGIAERMGVSRRQLRTYVSRLRAAGYLIVRERTLPGLGQVSSEYDFAPFLKAIVKAAGEREQRDDTHPGKDSSYPPRKSASSEEDKEQEDETLASKCAHEERGKRNDGLAAGDAPMAVPVASRGGTASLAEILGRRRDPKRTDGIGTAGDHAVEPTEALTAAITEVAQEFGDEHCLGPDLARTRSLLSRSGLSEEALIERVYRARSLVRERIRDGATDVRRRGAYFFVVLEGLLPGPTPKGTEGVRTCQNARLGAGNPHHPSDVHRPAKRRETGHFHVKERPPHDRSERLSGMITTSPT